MALTFDQSSYVTSGESISAAVADIDGDGNLDIATADGGDPTLDFGSDSITVYRGTANGTFEDNAEFYMLGGFYPISIVAGDFTGDGSPDLITHNLDGTVTFLRNENDGTGTFAAPVTSGPVLSPPTVAINNVAADFNGDGKLDLAVCNGVEIAVLMGNGDGTFQAPVTYSLNYPELLICTQVLTGDFTGNHMADIAVLAEGSLFIFPANGDGTFRPALPPTGTPALSNCAAAKFTPSGNLDLVTGNGEKNQVAVFLGNGHGTFAPPITYDVAGWVYLVAAGDFAGHGVQDIAAVVFGQDPLGGVFYGVSFLLGNGDGTFRPSIDLRFDQFISPKTAVAVDVNQDGRSELALVGSFDITLVLTKPAPLSVLPPHLAELGPYVRVIGGVANDGSGFGILPSGSIIHIDPNGPPDPVYKVFREALPELMRAIEIRQLAATVEHHSSRKSLERAGIEIATKVTERMLTGLRNAEYVPRPIEILRELRAKQQASRSLPRVKSRKASSGSGRD